MADFGWAFVRGGIVTGSAEVSGGVQYNDGGSGFAASSDLVFISGSTSQLNLTGALNVSGAINANELNITVTNQNVVNISSTGSTKFGDTSDDVHQFTGSVNILGNLSSSVNISASAFYGDGSNLTGISANPGGSDTQIQFNDAGSFGGSTSLTYDSTTLAVTGNISASINISASAFYGDGSNLTSLAGGSNNEIQLNNSGELAGSSNLTFDGTNLDVLGQLSASLGVTASAFHGDGSNLTNMAGGSSNEIQINNSGDLSGSTGLTYDSTTLAVTGNVSASVSISASAFYGDGSNLSGIATTLDEVTNNGNTTTNAMTASALNLTGLTAGTATNTSFLALDSSNNVVLTSSNGGNSTMIGEAEDGTYTDGLFSDFTTTTLIGTAIDKFNEILKIIVPGPAPAVDRINYTNTSGIETRLSFKDQADAPTDYIDVGTTGSFSSNVLIDEQYTVTTSGEDFRLGVYDGTQEITGVINFHVAEQLKTNEVNYSHDAFGNAESGSLKLYLNETLLRTLDLNGFAGSGNPNTGSATDLNSSGSGFFDVSVSASATDQNGSTYDIFQHRTAKYVIDPSDQNKGWNYAKVEHQYGSTTYVTNFVQWFNDTDAAGQQMTASNQAVAFTGNGSKYLSGVEYFRSASLVYTAEANNFYKFTYPTGSVLTFNTSSNLDNISPSGAAPTDGTDLFNKIFQITGSTDTNEDIMLNDSTTISFNLSHPLKTNLTTTGSVVTSQILIYNRDTANANDDENFELENFRLISGDYSTQASASDGGNAWNSENHMTSSGATGHTDGLIMYNSALRSPKQGANSGDFNSLTNGPSSNPDYSGVTGTRTFYRKIQNTLAQDIRDLRITSTKSTEIDDETLDSSNVRFEVKIPGSTGWMDISQNFSYGNTNDDDGALINGATPNSQTSETDTGNAVHCVTFGTQSVSNGEHVVVKIKADASWTGNISRLQFKLRATDDVSDPTESLDLDNIDLDDTAGETANLSFGTSNAVAGYTNVAGGVGSMGAVNSNGTYTDNGDTNRGVFKVAEVMGGTLNEDVSANGANYVANSFKNAYTGSLLLIVNDSTASTLSLANLNATNNLSSNTGFTVGAVAFSTTTDGIPDYTKPYRTGTYSIGTSEQRSGWNYARVIHRIGASDTVTNYVQWVIDPSGNVDNTEVSTPTISNFNHPTTYYQSGIGYFATNPSGTFSFTGSNFYNNVYQDGTAISFPTTTNCLVSNIRVVGSGITTFDSGVTSCDMPALNNTSDCETTSIEVTGTMLYNGATPSISGGLGLFTDRDVTVTGRILHPHKSNKTTNSASKTSFMIYSGSIGSTNLNTQEYFNTETYRIVSGNYVSQSNATSSANSWNPQTHMNAANAHGDGMVTVNGYAISPLKIGSAGDTRNVAQGGSLQAPTGNPNYSSLSENVRTYYRYFRNETGLAKATFTITLYGDANLVSKSGAFYTGTLGANKNINVELKVPFDPAFTGLDDTSTAWGDCIKPYELGTQPTSDGVGIFNGGGSDLNQTVDNDGRAIAIQLQGSQVRDDQYFVLKISAHEDWTGYLAQIAITY